MKLYLYDSFLNITSKLLNVSIKFNVWWLAKHLIDFRKKHIAKKLRLEFLPK